jgi:hypothetical protein
MFIYTLAKGVRQGYLAGPEIWTSPAVHTPA